MSLRACLAYVVLAVLVSLPWSLALADVLPVLALERLSQRRRSWLSSPRIALMEPQVVAATARGL